MLERKINEPILSNCAFEMEKGKTAIVIAVCTYHNKQKPKTNTLEFTVSDRQPSPPPLAQRPGNLLRK